MLTLTDEERKRGVATISSGNHGSSVSYAASLLGIQAVRVIVPENTPRSKVERIRYFGAEVLQMARSYVDDLFTVSEDAIGRAVSFMARQEKFIAEVGSCTTVAAVLEQRERLGGRNIALVLSGGNIDGSTLCTLLNQYH